MDDVRILIADSDISARNQLAKCIKSEGFETFEVADGISALKAFKRTKYDIIILDMELPELDGANVCRQIRKFSDVPIIIVSTHTTEADRLLGFELGADDYVIKPFYPTELLARVKVILKHSNKLFKTQPKILNFDKFQINTASRAVLVDDKYINLTPKEYELLLFLAQSPNKAFTRNEILNKVWGYDFYGSDRTIDTHIKSMRERIKPYGKYIVTVWGYGYKFETNL